MTRESTGIGRGTRISFIVTGALLTYGLSPAAPHEWHDTPSLRWLHLALAYGLLSVLFAVYTLLHIIGARITVQIGCYIGLALYLLGLIALLVTLRFDRPTNPLSIGAVLLSVVLHYAAGRNATINGARR